MALGRQWESRLNLWKENLEKRYITPLQELEMEYFTTFDHLRLMDASNGKFVKAPAGTKWGKKWEYGWFHTTVKIPEQLRGKRVIICLKTAEEMLVYVNGEERGSIDKKHGYITLTRCASGDEKYEIYAECYAGHGIRREDCGPAAIDEITVPEPSETQIVTGKSMLAVWNEEIFQVSMDYMALYELAASLPEESLRKAKIIKGLKEFTYIADFELPFEEMTASIIKADEVLKKLLECHNGSTAPEFTVFGQSHIDLAWLWPEEETKRKAARTYSNQLVLMEEYPEYKFLLCCPTVLNYIKEYYPGLYDKIREKKQEGAFIPEGAMWIECDTNIPSGESLIKQFVKGRRWFKEEMGTESVLAWMPDTFGFSAAVPQIMKKCGIKYFATQKLLRADPETYQFPYNIFWWEGNDGTKILTHIYKKNNSQFHPGLLNERWKSDRNQEEDIDTFIFPFGFGDGGGGPTRTMLEQARRCKDLEGAPRCVMESPVEFFKRINENEVENKYVGELYLAWHRGTYTTQSETKKGIRKAEAAIHDLEYFVSLALVAGAEGLFTKEDTDSYRLKLAELWDKLLFCQFHDIAPGTGIERVHKEAEEILTQVIKACYELIEQICSRPGTKTGKKYLYNTTSFEKHIKGVTIPAYSCIEAEKAVICRRADIRLKETEDFVDVSNDVFKARFNRKGEIISLVRFDDGKEYIESKSNCFEMFKDVNVYYDAWELGSMYEKLPVALEERALLNIENKGDECVLHIRRRLNNSELEQDIVIRNDSERIDFVTRIDWHERHKMLKVGFSADIHTNEAYEEIQFGCIKRPIHRSKQSDRDMYEVPNHKYTAVCDGSHGMAVLNDCKYGVSIRKADEINSELNGSIIRLTLLKSPLAPDMNADRGKHEFTYSLYAFPGDIDKSDVLSHAYDLNYSMVSTNHDFKVTSPIKLSAGKNIVIETVKPADTLENTLLIRVYEAFGTESTCEAVPDAHIKCVSEVDMLEENKNVLSSGGGKFIMHFKPFEIKTLLLEIK